MSPSPFSPLRISPRIFAARLSPSPFWQIHLPSSQTAFPLSGFSDFTSCLPSLPLPKSVLLPKSGLNILVVTGLSKQCPNTHHTLGFDKGGLDIEAFILRTVSSTKCLNSSASHAKQSQTLHPNSFEPFIPTSMFQSIPKDFDPSIPSL